MRDNPSGSKGLKSTLDRGKGGHGKERENLEAQARQIFKVNDIGPRHNICKVGSRHREEDQMREQGWAEKRDPILISGQLLGADKLDQEATEQR